jgi:hypothetical protein
MITFRRFGKLGRFGNQLFQYAGINLYARLHGYTAIIPKWIGNEIFKGVNPSYNPTEKIKSLFLPTCQLSDIKSYDKIGKIKFILGLNDRLPETTDIKNLYSNPKDNINFYSYFQDEFSLELLKKHKELVRKWFSFKPEIEDVFKKSTESIKPWIGVHVRRGDFVRLGFAVPTDKYLELLEKTENGKKLYISTDDKNIISDFKNFELINVSNPLPNVPGFIFDFWMLKNSETILGCGSTFSWWAAYLNEKGQYYSPPLTQFWPKGYVPKLEKIEL